MPLDAVPNLSVLPSACAEEASLPKLIERELKPLVPRIDREGFYPCNFLEKAGRLGAFFDSSSGVNLTAALSSARQISRACGSTGFLVWCQNANAWYLANTENEALRSQYSTAVSAGRLMGGTALSNPMKHFAGIEPLRLQGTAVAGGFEVSGSLPWVSNLGPSHAFGAIFSVENREVMAYLHCAQAGVSLSTCATFCALEGTATFGLKLDRVFVSTSQILADPAGAFVKKIQAGFVLFQLGFGFGLIQGSLDDIALSNQRYARANRALPDRPELLSENLAAIETRALRLAAEPLNPSSDYFREVLRVRLETAELALLASQSAALHAGAVGFIAASSQQRRLRESHFLAILTPSIRHLRQLLFP